MKIRTTMPARLIFLLLSTVLLLTSGCSALRTLIPGGVTLADAEWEGTKESQPVSLLVTVASSFTDPETARLLSIAVELSGKSDPLGSLLPITEIGSDQVRWIVCTESWVAKCKAIPLHAKIHAAGSINTVGHMVPKRLIADDFND